MDIREDAAVGKTEAVTRFVCGALLGFFSGLCFVVKYSFESTGSVVAIIAGAICVCGYLALKYGDDFGTRFSVEAGDGSDRAGEVAQKTSATHRPHPEDNALNCSGGSYLSKGYDMNVVISPIKDIPGEQADATPGQNALLQARARRLAALQAAEGLWKDRADIPKDGVKAQEQLRAEWL